MFEGGVPLRNPPRIPVAAFQFNDIQLVMLIAAGCHRSGAGNAREAVTEAIEIVKEVLARESEIAQKAQEGKAIHARANGGQ